MFDRTFYDWMEMEYVSLGDGLTQAGQSCPVCKGNGCLSVSRAGKNLLWLCHRASCGFRKGGGLLASLPKAERVVEYPATFTLTPVMQEYLSENYGIDSVSSNRAGIRFTGPFYSGDCNRWYLPINTVDGDIRGYVARAMDKGITPKTFNRTEKSDALAWYPNRSKTKNILVVEDQLSAIRASNHITSVALLGTHLNEDRLDELLAFDTGKVYLALDRDAVPQAVEYVRKFRGRSSGRLQLYQLLKDIKNQTPPIFEETMKNVTQ